VSYKDLLYDIAAAIAGLFVTVNANAVAISEPIDKDIIIFGLEPIPKMADRHIA